MFKVLLSLNKQKRNAAGLSQGEGHEKPGLEDPAQAELTQREIESTLKPINLQMQYPHAFLGHSNKSSQYRL